MTSRDPADLEPQLRALWEWAQVEWKRLYPAEPQPFLTATFRGPVSQEEAVRNGSSDLPFGYSLHNFHPAYAFDIAFLKQGRTDYTLSLFQRFAALLKPYGIEWGGDWDRLVDGPHFQLPMTAEDARAGRVPRLALPVSAPTSEPGWAVVVSHEGGKSPTVIWLGADEHIVTRVAPDRKRFYLDIRKD